MSEKYVLKGRLEQAFAGGTVSLSGSWTDVRGVVVAQGKYTLEPTGSSEIIELSTAVLPPSGNYPGRMNFGGGNTAVKKQQMVDRMVMRFKDEEGIKGEGEGTNRVGGYTLDIACRKEGTSWELELSRVYTPLAPPVPAPSEPQRKARASQDSLLAPAQNGPRKPRAAAPPKGAYAPRKDEKPFIKPEDGPAGTKKRTKNQDSTAQSSSTLTTPCYLIVFGQPPPLLPDTNTEEEVAVPLPSDTPPTKAFRCSSIVEAQDKMQGLIHEIEALIRLPSDQGDGVLFPPADNPHLTTNQNILKSLGGPPPTLPTKCNHLIVFDVDATAAKARSWRASVAAFATAARAARHALHIYRTCGPKLKSLEWLAFDNIDATEAKTRARIFTDGTFDTEYAIPDFAALEAAAS